jgi:predicted nucleic acid-binding protein
MSLLQELQKTHLIFLDTAPLIYFVEGNPSFASQVQPIFNGLDNGTLTAVASPITLAECLVLPYKLGNPDLAQTFINLMVDNQSVVFYSISETTAERAAELRARYNLTLTDAFQIAIAMQSGCDAFLTNDIELKRVTDIPILVLSEA